jgi:hypothetical protein
MVVESLSSGDGQSDECDQPAKLAPQLASDFQFQQHSANDSRRGAGQPDQIIDRDGRWPEQA